MQFLRPALLIVLGGVLTAAPQSESARRLKVNQELEGRTAIRKSGIPNAGNGLFALVKISKGQVVGELGGVLITEDEYPSGNHYIGSIAECALKKSHPYKYIDSREHGAHVSRINFAPSRINGKDTNLQNSAIKQLCEHPYFIFVALRDIAPGEEILASYGASYNYDSFMKDRVIQSYFCARANVDCSGGFKYEH